MMISFITILTKTPACMGRERSVKTRIESTQRRKNARETNKKGKQIFKEQIP